MKARNSVSTIAMLALLALASAASAQNGGEGPQSLEGAWTVTINFADGRSCPSAPAVATREGTIIADSCARDLGAGYGAWVRTGNRQFATTFIGNVYAPNGALIGSYKVRAAGPMDQSGESFGGPFVTQFFDLAGNVTMTATGTVSAKRIRVEPL